MKFSEITQRLTGLSCGVFGISWTPSISARTIAHRIIVFLEDRRVLFVPSEMELLEHCIHSVIEIRKYLTSELQNISNESKFAEPIRSKNFRQAALIRQVGFEPTPPVIKDMIRYSIIGG